MRSMIRLHKKHKNKTQEDEYLGIKKAACLQKTDGVFLFSVVSVHQKCLPHFRGGVVASVSVYNKESLVSDPPHFRGGVVEETIQKIVPVLVSIAQTA